MKRAPILLAVDASPASLSATEVAGVIALATNARVAVLHVDRPGERVEAGVAPDRRAVEQLAVHGVRAEVVVRGGEPADEILAAGRALGSGLIVMGSRGRSALGGLLLGSVSREVTARATRPVLVVRAQAGLTSHPRILLAIEGLAGSVPLVDTVATLARALGATVTVVHVSYPGGEHLERAIYHARETHGEQAMSDAVRRLKRKRIDSTAMSVVAIDGVARAISRCAASVDAQLIVLGSHEPVHAAAPAGTELSTAVLHRTKRPVLVLRERETP